VAGGGELAGERHREAAGVRGGDELFGIRPGAVFEARAERVLRVAENAAIGGDAAFPSLRLPFQTAEALRLIFMREA
jgi:hypothetical protein